MLRQRDDPLDQPKFELALKSEGKVNSGTLKINIVKACLCRDTSLIMKMSPFVTIQYKGNKQKTPISKGGGKSPEWNYEFELPIEDVHDNLELRVWSANSPIGFVFIKISGLVLNGGMSDWYTIWFDQKRAGEVLISTKFEVEGGNPYE